ncbi:MAG: hypothetical protein MAG794_00990 [Gammaproteobacteria bacterium]|nr:hypothetical protein [Gammaproteobacteria bacterium]
MFLDPYIYGWISVMKHIVTQIAYTTFFTFHEHVFMNFVIP